MKVKLTISLDKETIEQIEYALKGDLFRSKSHLIEYSIKKFLGGTQNEN